MTTIIKTELASTTIEDFIADDKNNVKIVELFFLLAYNKTTFNVLFKEETPLIKITLTNPILKLISEIDQNKFSLNCVHIPTLTANKLRKYSKKKSSYASNKIEGNPLTEKQVNEVIDSDPHRHFLKPEQEVRNYFLALNLLEKKAKKKRARTIINREER